MYVTALIAFSFAFLARFSALVLQCFCKVISCVKVKGVKPQYHK